MEVEDSLDLGDFLYIFLAAPVDGGPEAAPSWRKSSKTELLHFGHLGSFSDSITYIRHRGQPTSTIDVASGLLEYRRAAPLSSWFSSNDTQELGGDVGDNVADRLGDNPKGCCRGGDRFNFNSSFGTLPLLLLLIFSSSNLCFNREKKKKKKNTNLSK